MQIEQFIKHLGENIQKLRLIKQLTQLELADKCNMDKSAYARIEQGRTNPSVKTLKLIADSLDLQVKDLFDFNN